MGVLIGCRALKFVEKELRVPISRRTIWTDSECVLHWLKSTKKLKVFVENRLKEIRSCDDTSFRYVASKDNPADFATKEHDVTSVLNGTLWWNGPQWLQLSESEWPEGNVPNVSPEVLQKVDTETKGEDPMYHLSLFAGEDSSERQDEKVENLESPFGLKAEDFSSLTRLLRITAYAQRFMSKLKGTSAERESLTNAEIQAAKLTWDTFVQKRNFMEVYQAIKSNKKNELKEKLGLKIDDKGLLRCHGRFCNAELFNDAVHPKLLPRKDPYTDLVVNALHKSLMHARQKQTLAQLRMEYWITHGLTEVKRILTSCRVCRRYEGGPFPTPEMPPYPKARVAQYAAFTYVGVDYLGPLYVKNGSGEVTKVWICLFTCLTSRAIHLEVIRNMTAEQFMYGLRRFIAKFGKPKRITSDNAPQFKLTKTALDKLWLHAVSDEDVQSYIATQGIEWTFIPELSPWMGGFYERMVGLVKRALKKSIGKVCLTFEQLRTILTEVQAVINSRPLTYIGGDFEERWTICPADFLTMNPKTGAPEMIENDNNDPDFRLETMSSAEQILDMWKKGQSHLKQFWKLWTEDYMLSLRERTQTHLKGPRIKSKFYPTIGDVVLIKENLPRGAWKAARIQELKRSSDGNYRSAKLILPNKKAIMRPVSLLYPLECAESDHDEAENGDTAKIGGTSRNIKETNQRTRSSTQSQIRHSHHHEGSNQNRNEIESKSNRNRIKINSRSNQNPIRIESNRSDREVDPKPRRKAAMVARDRLSVLARQE